MVEKEEHRAHGLEKGGLTDFLNLTLEDSLLHLVPGTRDRTEEREKEVVRAAHGTAVATGEAQAHRVDPGRGLEAMEKCLAGSEEEALGPRVAQGQVCLVRDLGIREDMVREREVMGAEPVGLGTVAQNLMVRGPLGVETGMVSVVEKVLVGAAAAHGLKMAMANMEVEMQVYRGHKQCSEALQADHGNKVVTEVRTPGLQREVLVMANLAMVVPDPGRVLVGEEMVVAGRLTREALESGSEMSARRVEAASVRRQVEDGEIIICHPKVVLAGMDKQADNLVVVAAVAGMAAHRRKAAVVSVEDKEVVWVK